MRYWHPSLLWTKPPIVVSCSADVLKCLLLGLQARGGEILGRLGLYFAGLLIDKVSGTDDTNRVRLRAAQLR